MFLDPAARELFVGWEEHARACVRACVESLRLDLGTYPDDRRALDLVAGLCERSPDFRAWW